MAIKIGDHFPGFTLNDHNSNAFDTNSLLGKTNLIIYFYPKNETYNCTKQACNFRDDFSTFRNLLNYIFFYIVFILLISTCF